MTRLNDHLLVQRVDTEIVLSDESAGEEVAVPIALLPALLDALQYFEYSANVERYMAQATEEATT